MGNQVEITDTITVDDLTDDNIQSAVVAFSSGYVSGEDVLHFTDTANITGDWQPTNQRIVLLGEDTLANYQAALRSIEYENTSSTSSRTIGNRVMNFAVRDVTGRVSNTESRIIDVKSAWRIDNLTLINTMFISAPTPEDIKFKTDGTKMYYAERQNEILYQFDLSTAWDLSTASDSGFFSVGLLIRGFDFKDDGTKIYMSNGSSVSEYDLSVAWDITSSITFVASFSLSETDAHGPKMKPDGTKYYITTSPGGDGITVEYEMSTAWDISTSARVNQSVDNISGSGLDIKPDGTNLYLTLVSHSHIVHYEFGTAWDVTTLNKVYSVDEDEDLPLFLRGIAFKPDGTKVYLIDSGNDAIYEYSTI